MFLVNLPFSLSVSGRIILYFRTIMSPSIYDMPNKRNSFDEISIGN